MVKKIFNLVNRSSFMVSFNSINSKLKYNFFKKLIFSFFLLFTSICFANNTPSGDLRIFSLSNPDFNPSFVSNIEKQLEKDGFYISANSEMTKPFMIQFQQSDFKIFNLLTVFHIDLSDKLIKKHHNAGLFVPMGIGIYQSNEDKELHVSILTPKAQSKILGLSEVDPILIEIEQKMIASIQKAIPGASVSIENDNPLKAEGDLISLFEYELDDANDWEDDKEEVAMTIEDGFTPLGFVMSNYTEYNYMLTKEETVDSPFDFYDTYSICKLKVIYNVAKTRPQASAFAPCSMMFYKVKGSDKIIMGFPAVYNWLSSARIVDANAKKELMKAQNDFEGILKSAIE